MKRIVFISLLTLVGYQTASAQRVIYVNQAATGANDGATWSDAFIHLQDALLTARPGDDVWVAEGVYRPDQGAGIGVGDRDTYFLVPSETALFGGFRGTELALADRPSPIATTLLSGDLARDDPAEIPPDPAAPHFSDNSRKVLWKSRGARGLGGFTVSGGTELAVLVGSHDPTTCVVTDLVIEGNVGQNAMGLSDCSALRIRVANNSVTGTGALTVSTPATISESVIVANRSASGPGGIYVAGRDSLIMRDTLVMNNVALRGGGLQNVGGPTVLIASSRFIGNEAECGGGALYLDEFSTIRVSNTLFASNHAAGACPLSGAEFNRGGAALIYQGRFEVDNSTFANNSAPGGGGALAFFQAEGYVHNSLVADNGANAVRVASSALEVAFSLFEELPSDGVTEGDGVREEPFEFSNPAGPDMVLGTADDNYELTSDQSAIDAGASSLVPLDYADVDSDGLFDEPLPLDLWGRDRVVGQAIDLGAFEYEPTPSDVMQESEGKSCSIEAFPNPATSSVLVRTSGLGELSFYDALGREILATSAGPYSSLLLSTTVMPRGLILVRGGEGSGCVSSFIVI